MHPPRRDRAAYDEGGEHALSDRYAGKLSGDGVRAGGVELPWRSYVRTARAAIPTATTRSMRGTVRRHGAVADLHEASR